MQVFFAILVGAFFLGQAGPNLQNLVTAAGAAVGLCETIDRVSFVFVLIVNHTGEYLGWPRVNQ